MRVILRRQNDAVHFVATTDAGGMVPIDGAPAVGGEGRGARPMELLLAGLGGCSAIDVITILRKQRQSPAEVTVTVEAEREPGKEPSLFSSIHVHFAFRGDCEEEKVARAVALSMDKYCSVARILERTATITYSHSLEAVPA